MRSTRLLFLLILILIAITTLYYLGGTPSRRQAPSSPRPAKVSKPPPSTNFTQDVVFPPEKAMPLRLSHAHAHPIEQLIDDAQEAWNEKMSSQSSTLAEAVTEYKRRYGMPPPPHFDKWFNMAKKRKVRIIDDYDTIYHSLLPFWALPPDTIRARARESLGYNNFLMAVTIRDHKVTLVENGPDWLREAIQGMIKPFIKYLPDMDLAFNTHDEPRVVLPHDELANMINHARTTSIPAINTNHLTSYFSPRPTDLHLTPHPPETSLTRFNEYPHQATWLPSRLSCPLNTPARQPLDTHPADHISTYALSPLNFIHNQTAYTDVCLTPSFASTHGFFDRPNAFNLVHDLFPVFSQSKMSNFQDILFPSPWYWSGRVQYNGTADLDWRFKLGQLWWRGSTTGGFSRDGGWKRQHRQILVRRVNALDNAEVMTRGQAVVSGGMEAPWEVRKVKRAEYADLMDVHFSHVGQCDDADCLAQREFFLIVPPADQQDAWRWKYLLDMDGNAFSGRFYAFLRSRSLTFKMAVFREWHQEWIQPWLHYVPIGLKGDELLEAVRWFDREEKGQKEAARMSEESTRWAQEGLRNEDLEVWFFRLLLEYARLIDDNRDSIGFEL